MAIYLSAGHNNNDSGAIGVNGRKENLETIGFRKAVLSYMRPGYHVIIDQDNESLREYLRRIKPGNASVVLEVHFDSYNGKASGTMALYADGAAEFSVNFAKQLMDLTSEVLGIPNRGAKSEKDSARGRLGLVHEEGIAALLEICFIDNPGDMAAYDAHLHELAKGVAELLMDWDDLIK